MNIEKIKEVVKAVDVTNLSIEELYYYFLLVRELERNHIISYGTQADTIITEEDYD